MTVTVKHHEVHSLRGEGERQFCCLVSYAPKTPKATRQEVVRAAREADPAVGFWVKPNTDVAHLIGGYVPASYYAGSAENVKGELLCIFNSADAEAAFTIRVGDPEALKALAAVEHARAAELQAVVSPLLVREERR